MSNASSAQGIHKIKHVVIIMQENRSFDSYFGTYPSADGIPMQNGVPTVCVPNRLTAQCDPPYHGANDLNHGGPHGQANATADIAGGKMDGFIAQAEAGIRAICQNPFDPRCTAACGPEPDVMGYHFDAYLKFIEDDFMSGQRIDPATDGRPDPRPDVRENASQLGDLVQGFDFNQQPRPPLILPTNPQPGPASTSG